MKKLTIFLVIAIGIIIGCGDTTKPLFQVTELANMTASFVDSNLGKAKTVTPITSYPEQMPGEYRDYILADGSEMQMKFYRDKAVEFTVWLKNPTSMSRSALKYFGITSGDIMPLPIIVKRPTVRVWEGTIRGVTFKRISSQKSEDKWEIIQAIVEGAP